MAKSRWQLGFEALAAELRAAAAARRQISAVDPAADGLDYAAARAEAKVRSLLEPTTMLTTDEWAAEQDPPVAGGTARRWCRDGELECIETPRGYLIPVGAVRKPKRALQLMGVPPVGGDALAGGWPQGELQTVEPPAAVEAAS